MEVRYFTIKAINKLNGDCRRKSNNHYFRTLIISSSVVLSGLITILLDFEYTNVTLCGLNDISGTLYEKIHIKYRRKTTIGFFFC